MDLPNYEISIICAGAGTALFFGAGLTMFVKMWRQYEKDYIDGAATTLDAMYVSMPAQNILYLSIFCSLFVACLIALLSGQFLFGIPFGIGAFFIPRIILYLLKLKRDEQFEYQFVDALMNISNSLRAGFTLPQALELVHREMPDPMSQEIRLVCQELRLGVSIDDALANLYKRMPNQDVDIVVTAISIVRDVGGNLTEIFDNLANTIRERHRIQGKIKALTAQGKAQAVVVCLLPVIVGVGLSFVAPQMFQQLYQTFYGWCMIVGIVVLEVVGALIIRKIVTIDV